jgi:hypothetical protein
MWVVTPGTARPAAKEQVMSLHPTITAALADQHRRDLMSQASASRQARAARQARPRTQARRPLIIRALRTATAASAIAGAAFLVIPAAPGHVPSANGNWSTSHQGHTSWGEHYRARDSHRVVLAVHWRTHRFGVGHHFQAIHVYSDRWA